MTHAGELAAGQRFDFGENWSRFLRLLNDERIGSAEDALAAMLGTRDLTGKTFLDIGSGSGLMSLAARRLGAHVTSFDFDPKSVACTTELRKRYYNGDSAWRVSSGSVLDSAFMTSLGTFDIVYSWGVLHHTGKMWDAIRSASSRVAPQGFFFIAIYNDQGIWSRYWTVVKKIYNRGRAGRIAMILLHIPHSFLARLALRAATGRLRERRGMSLWYDMIDWLGGYPFEVATPEAIIDFVQPMGFTLSRMTTCGTRPGCNEFVFQRGR
jgi:2-polyprenyl-3-methyl-5-hydroxy-6-metoxy-1,4-benzoquinol methylase